MACEMDNTWNNSSPSPSEAKGCVVSNLKRSSSICKRNKSTEFDTQTSTDKNTRNNSSPSPSEARKSDASNQKRSNRKITNKYLNGYFTLNWDQLQIKNQGSGIKRKQFTYSEVVDIIDKDSKGEIINERARRKLHQMVQTQAITGSKTKWNIEVMKEQAKLLDSEMKRDVNEAEFDTQTFTPYRHSLSCYGNNHTPMACEMDNTRNKQAKLLDSEMKGDVNEAECDVESITDIKGHITSYKYSKIDLKLCVKWENYDETHNSWEPYENIQHTTASKQFCLDKKLWYLLPNIDDDINSQHDIARGDMTRGGIVDKDEDKEFTLEAILDIQGNIPDEQYLPPHVWLHVKWMGYDESSNTWEPYSEIKHTEAFQRYCSNNNLQYLIPLS